MARAPLVSVLLPVRDAEATLSEAVESVLGQTFADFELVLVDDGSSDGSPDVAASFERADRRVRVVCHPAAGLVAALQAACTEARGRLLARMDADDVALSHRLEAQVEALAAEPGLAAVGGRVELVPRSDLRDGMRRYERWINELVTERLAARDVFVECPVPHPTLMIRREELDAVGGYRDLGWPEDYDLLLRLWAAGRRFRNVPETVLRWRDDPARLSRRHPTYATDAFVRCKVHHLRATLLRGRAGAVVWGAGPVGKSFARELVRRDVRLLAFVEVHPRRLGRAIHGAPVVDAEQAARVQNALHLAAVAGAAARAEIRETAAGLGLRDGVDLVAVA